MNEILEKLEKLGTLHRNSKKNSVFNDERTMILREFSWFIERFSSGSIFGWKIFPTESWFSSSYNVNQYLVGGLTDGGVEHLENMFVIASSSFKETVHVAIDLTPGRVSYVGLFWYQGDLNWGGYPIIAKSFEEWLARTLDNRYENGAFYWEKPDFVDLGPAIPDDPFYKPIGRVV